MVEEYHGPPLPPAPAHEVLLVFQPHSFPKVVEHFESRAPLFDYFPGRSAEYPNVLTSTAAISATCLLRVIDIAARRAGATWFVHAGTHLGAALHGGSMKSSYHLSISERDPNPRLSRSLPG